MQAVADRLEGHQKCWQSMPRKTELYRGGIVKSFRNAAVSTNPCFANPFCLVSVAFFSRTCLNTIALRVMAVG